MANGAESCTSTDGDTIGNVLTTSTATFTGSQGTYDTNATHGNATFSGNDHVEYATAVEFVAADLNDGDTLNFRVAGLDGYDTPITITISKVNNYTLSTEGGSYSVNGEDWGVRFDGTTDGINCGDVHDFTGNAPFTIEFWTNIDATQPGGSFVRLISKEKTTSLTDGWQVGLNVSGTTIRLFRLSNDTNDATADGYTAGTNFHYAGVYDGTDLQGFINGVGGTKVASSRSLPGNTNPLRFGRPVSASNEFAGILDEIRIWDYARTQAEIFRDKDRTLTGSETGLVGYWRMDEGTGTTVADSASTNDGTMEGDPEWVAGLINTGLYLDIRLLAANGGSYAYSGQDATLTHDGGSTYTLATDGGSYSISGVAASLEYHSAIDALVGAYAISGVAANLEYHSVIGADAGAYTYSGVDANLEYHQLFGAEGGAYSISGVDANLEYHQLFAAAGGSYAINGTDITLVYSIVLDVEGGAYSVSGVDASLLHTALLGLESGAYAVAGQDVNLEYHSVLSAESGLYTLSGQVASLEYHSLLAAAVGAYNLVGGDANLELHSILGAESGSYDYAGQDATLTFTPLGSYTITADPGSYAISGTDADLLFSPVLGAGPGVYSYNGQSVGLTYTPVGGNRPFLRRVSASSGMHIGI